MLDSYTRQPYPRLGGLVTCIPPQNVPVGAAPVCQDADFTPKTVKSRNGLTQVFEVPSSQRINGLGVLIRQASSNTQIPLVFGSAGVLYKETDVGTGALEQIASALNVGTYMFMTTAYNKAYLAFSDLVAGVTANRPRQYLKYGSDYFLDNLGLAVNTVPLGVVGPSAADGDVPVGTRYCTVLFKTRSGYISGMSEMAVLAVTLTDEGKQIQVQGIPLGPGNCTARIIAFTEAGLSSDGPFLWIPDDFTIQGLNAGISKTIIEDNSTTEATFNFTDQVLRAASDVTQFFDKIVVPPVVGARFIKSLKRVAYWGNEDEPSTVFMSEADDPETLYATLSRIDVAENDGQRVQNVFEFRGETYAAKERGGQVIVPGTGFPSTWSVDERWTGVGPCGPQALDVCEEFVCFAHRSGLYKYTGGAPEWISWEHSGACGLWAQINWAYGQLISVKIDTETKRIFVSVPLGQATAPDKVLMLNYQLGFTAPVVENPSSKALTSVSGRRWSLWNTPCNLIIRAERNLAASPNPNTPVNNETKTSQLLLASSAADGAVNMLDPTATTDNGQGMIGFIYQAAYMSAGGILQFGAVEFQAKGNGAVGVAQMSDEDAATEKRPRALVAGKQKTYTVKGRGQSDMWAVRLHAVNPGDTFEISDIALWLNKIWKWTRGTNGIQ